MKEFLYYAVSNISIDPLPDTQADQQQLDLILNVVFGIAGSIALLFLVIGGFRYIVSRGDPNGTNQAKGTIIYSIIGLIVVILAFVIVSLVIRSV